MQRTRLMRACVSGFRRHSCPLLQLDGWTISLWTWPVERSSRPATSAGIQLPTSDSLHLFVSRSLPVNLPCHRVEYLRQPRVVRAYLQRPPWIAAPSGIDDWSHQNLPSPGSFRALRRPRSRPESRAAAYLVSARLPSCSQMSDAYALLL